MWRLAVFEAIVERVIGELGEARESSRTMRGEARAGLVERLRAIDGEVMAAAWAITAAADGEAIRREAEQEIVAFRSRMPAEEYARVADAAASRLLRERLRLPDMAYTS